MKKEEFIYKVNDLVSVTDVKQIVSDYIKNNIIRGLDVDYLMLLCNIKSDNYKYRVFDICPTCHTVRIGVNKKYVDVKTKYLTTE